MTESSLLEARFKSAAEAIDNLLRVKSSKEHIFALDDPDRDGCICLEKSESRRWHDAGKIRLCPATAFQ